MMDEPSLEDLTKLAKRTVERLERNWRKQIEARPLLTDTTLYGALCKCPSPWLNGVSACLGIPKVHGRKEKAQMIASCLQDNNCLEETISSLPKVSRRALIFILRTGGWMKYTPLCRRFGGETGDGWWWDERLPHSPLGQLRVRGLLFVGKAPLGPRYYKVAVVPAELRQALYELLLPQDGGPVLTEAIDPDLALKTTLSELEVYYKHNRHLESLLPKKQVEEFLNHLASDKGAIATHQEAWESLKLFNRFLTEYIHEVQSLNDIRSYHLSEWVNSSIERHSPRQPTLQEKRRMLRVIRSLFIYLEAYGGVGANTCQVVRDTTTKLSRPSKKMGIIHRPPPLGGEVLGTTIRGNRIQLKVTVNHYWLWLVCQTDFNGDWEALSHAAAVVPDGKAKSHLAREIATNKVTRLCLPPPGLQRELREEVQEARQWFYTDIVLTLSTW